MCSYKMQASELPSGVTQRWCLLARYKHNRGPAWPARLVTVTACQVIQRTRRRARTEGVADGVACRVQGSNSLGLGWRMPRVDKVEDFGHLVG